MPFQPPPDEVPPDFNEAELIEKPLIIGLVCGLAVLGVIVLAVVIYILCKRLSNVHEPPTRGLCNHRNGYANTGYNYMPRPLPYYPTEVVPNGSHQCVCQTIRETELPLSIQRNSLAFDTVHNGQSERDRRHMSVDRSLNELPIFQTPPQQILNPIYNENFEGDETDQIDVPNDDLSALFKITDRSFTQTVGGKLVVSLARYVDHHGDTLILDNMGISLKIPKGAIKRGQKQWITLVLNWDLTDNPSMTPKQSLVSPVVYVGPHGLKLEKPCTLSYRHCSFDTRHIQVMRSETDLTDAKSWEVVCDRGDRSEHCYLTQDECQLQIEKFTLYTCVQTPIDDQIGKKWLQIAVFACPLRREINHHQVRVYFLNKTPCALQWAIQHEAGFGGKLVCPEKVFLFDGGEHDMFAKTRYISDGWKLVDNDNLDKTSFLTIWHGHCPHISVCYKRCPLASGHRSEQSTTVAIEMSLHLLTYQDRLHDNGEKIFIQVAEDNVTPVTDNEIKLQEKIEININNILHKNFRASDSSSGYVTRVRTSAEGSNQRDSATNSRDSATNFRDSATNSRDSVTNLRDSATNHRDSANSQQIQVNINNVQCAENFIEIADQIRPRIVPYELRRQLSVLLDPTKRISGNDWRQLAGMLELDSCIPKLETFDNPTEHLLNAVEYKDVSLDKLSEMFRSMDREDCARTVELYANESRNSLVKREPNEFSESGYQAIRSQSDNQRNSSTEMSWDSNSRPTNPSQVQVKRTSLYNTHYGFNETNRSDLVRSRDNNWSFGKRYGPDNRGRTHRKQAANGADSTVWSIQSDREARQSTSYEINNLSDPRTSNDRSLSSRHYIN